MGRLLVLSLPARLNFILLQLDLSFDFERIGTCAESRHILTLSQLVDLLRVNQVEFAVGMIWVEIRTVRRFHHSLASLEHLRLDSLSCCQPGLSNFGTCSSSLPFRKIYQVLMITHLLNLLLHLHLLILLWRLRLSEEVVCDVRLLVGQIWSCNLATSARLKRILLVISPLLVQIFHNLGIVKCRSISIVAQHW